MIKDMPGQHRSTAIVPQLVATGALAFWGTVASVVFAAPKLPDMKTPEQKLRALEYFRATGPWKSIKNTDSFGAKDLDKSLEHEIKLPEDRYAPLADDATFFRRV